VSNLVTKDHTQAASKSKPNGIWPKRWQTNSLKVRLILSTLLMTMILLPIVGVTLSNAFEQQLYISLKNELKASSYSIFTVAEVENSTLVMPELLLDNQFNISQSGLYALITTLPVPSIDSGVKQVQPINSKDPLWQSQSLLTLTIPKLLPQPEVGTTQLTTINLQNHQHLLYSFSVSFSDNGQAFPVTLHLIKDQQASLAALHHFRQQLWLWLLVLMAVFIIVQVVWLLWTLKPLTQLTHELESIEKGEQNALNSRYPDELQQVTQQLNALLVTEENQRNRYRNALADLAHSLKNPLAVIQSQPGINSSGQEQLQRINQIIEHQLKRAQSAGQSAWHLGVQIEPVLDKLLTTLAKIYRDKAITFNVQLESKFTFKGDEADLMEMLGNILDNACKAANGQVAIKITAQHAKLIIEIADDGIGINESQQAVILSRGGRADTYQAGHGIGLAIVNDLVASYQGQLLIANSSTLSGAAFTLIFDI